MKIVIGSDNEIFQRDVSQAVKKIAPDAETVNLRNWANLFGEVKCFGNTVLVCDKFFLGLKNRLVRDVLMSLNENLRIAVLDYGSEQVFLGYRLYAIGFNCFLNEIENERNLSEGLKTFLTAGEYFPSAIRDYVGSGRLSDIREYLGELTDGEIEVGIKKSMGMTSKEIDIEHPGRVDVKYHRFIRKTGFTRADDMRRFLAALNFAVCI